MSKPVIEESVQTILSKPAEWMDCFIGRVEVELLGMSNVQMGLLLVYIINKLMSRQPMHLVHWIELLSNYLPRIINSLNVLRDINHVEKVIEGWRRDKLVNSDRVANWLALCAAQRSLPDLELHKDRKRSHLELISAAPSTEQLQELEQGQG
ncbi:hypothetical protein EON64_15855, partial [archaeon]